MAKFNRAPLTRGVATCAVAAMLSACASLPTSGPTASQVVKAARSDQNVMGFRVVDVDAANIGPLSDTTPVLPTAELGTTGLAALARTGRVDVIGPGDVLQISVFEVGASLFSGGGGQTVLSDSAVEASARRGTAAGIAVDEDGMISVPYVGRLAVAGKTANQVARMIEAGLAGKSQSPQVIVSIADSRASTVLVSGQTRSPGRYRLTGARETILDVIADSGGVAAGNGTAAATGSADNPEDIIVRFTRGDRSLDVPLAAIRSRSPDDLVLLPRDRIELLRRERTYTVFGAANRINQTPFGSPNLSLAEAMARAGGPNDSLADPTAVFIFRYVPGQDAAKGEAPMIYRVNLMKPSSYFLSQRFQMRDKDVIYVANSASNLPTKFVSIINLLFSPIFSGIALSNALNNN